MNRYAEPFDSPLGTLTIVASDKGICSIHFGEKQIIHQLNDIQQVEKYLSLCKQQLVDYFEGKRITFSLNLAISGTPFQVQVWRVLQEIPFGQTISYKELAHRIGNVNACRAVGMANNRNPLPIIIPCHRVVGASGKMVGYACEIWRKQWLLEHESRNFIYDFEN
jgi:O-6-methylguanine DNA methyltransferase